MSNLEQMSTLVAFRLSNGSTARGYYMIPEGQEDADYIRKMISESVKGGSSLQVNSIDKMNFAAGDAEIFPQHIVAFIVNPQM